MKSSETRLKVIVVLLLLAVPAIIDAQGGLLGKWKYVAPGGEMIMQVTNNTLIINGQSFSYKQENNTLQVYDGNTYTNYPFRLNGNQLTLVFPYGQEIVFTRDASAPVQENRLPMSMQRPAAGNPAGGGSSLAGKWMFQSQQGQLTLEFLSSNQLVFNGETTTYQMKEGVIQAMGDYGWIDYPYTLQQGRLTITFPDGTQIPFVRTTSMPAQQDMNQQGMYQQGMNQQANAGGQVWQLRGTLCMWAGSSDSNSGYSRTEKISFDGQGNFTYGKESSFSSDAGIAYGSNPNVQRGTYSVEERYVILKFQTGETYKVEINMRQDNGMITELMYNGQLYATALCDQ